MRYQVPPLPALHAFEAAARHASFAAAAVELHLSQAAVSHRVRLLERHLGFKLFERLPRSLRLTDMGRAYLPSVRKAFDELSLSTAGLFGPVGERSVTVRAPVSYAVLWLAPRLESFLKAYPDIDLRLGSAIWADALDPDEADIDIRFGHGHWPGFAAEFLSNEPAIPVCSPRHVEALGPVRSVADLAERPLVHITGLEDLWMRLFKSAGLETPAGAGHAKSDTSLAALELVANSQRCTLVPRSFAQGYLDQGRLIPALEVDVPMDLSHYLLVPDNAIQRLKPEALMFRQWLLEESQAQSTPA